MERLRKLSHGWSRTKEQSSATASNETFTAAGDDCTREVEVIYGASVQTLALAGLTVAQARPLVETILAVHPRSPALVNGVPARTNQVIAEGDSLEFVHHAGEKGFNGFANRDRGRSGHVPSGR
jgi:hypothetical protein